MIAALYVIDGGPYFGLEGVDPWPESRDARKYAGPWPVVAHPPCSRWCRLAGLVEARWGHKRGEDDGCFAAALEAVRKWGGVLEHPAYSDAWAAFGLPIPSVLGGWTQDLFDVGASCHVEQGRYGHPAKKATWLYAVGTDLPALRWGRIPYQQSRALVSWCGNRVARDEKSASSRQARGIRVARRVPGPADRARGICSEIRYDAGVTGLTGSPRSLRSRFLRTHLARRQDREKFVIDDPPDSPDPRSQ